MFLQREDLFCLEGSASLVLYHLMLFKMCVSATFGMVSLQTGGLVVGLSLVQANSLLL